MTTNRFLQRQQQNKYPYGDYATQLLSLRSNLTSLVKWVADAHGIDWGKINGGHVGDLVEANRMLEEVRAFLGVEE